MTNLRFRIAPAGAVLLMGLLGVALRPPEGDPQLAGIVWSALLGLLVIGAVWPLLAVATVRVTVKAPRDLVVGDRAELDVTLDGRGQGLEVRALDPPGGWYQCRAPGPGGLPHVADRRGVFVALRVEARSHGPLGVAVVTRQSWVTLERPVTVAPRPSPVAWSPRHLGRASEDVSTGGLAAATGDVTRSVRPYVTGDPAHLVHWPSSARTGGLVVRELEPPAPLGQAVVVDLRAPVERTDLVELAASRAAGLVRAVLGAGGRVLLVTCEPAGPVCAPVTTTLDAGRRLARAVPGAPPEVPSGWPALVVSALDEGAP